MDKLTWGELANIFNKSTGLNSMNICMSYVYEWAANQHDKFYVDDDGYLYLVDKESNNGQDG